MSLPQLCWPFNGMVFGKLLVICCGLTIEALLSICPLVSTECCLRVAPRLLTVTYLGPVHKGYNHYYILIDRKLNYLSIYWCIATGR